MRRRSVLALLLPLLAAIAPSLGAGTGPDAELPDPAAPGSHAAFLEYLEGGEDLVFRGLLARYDEHLAQHPGDVAAHVERCRFLAAASCDEDEECPYWEEHERCVAQLDERFPAARTVDLYRLERSWGDEGIEVARSLLEGRARAWQKTDLATLHEKLANLYLARRDEPLVLANALRALELDPSLDRAILAARALKAKGERARAIEVLTTIPTEPASTETYWAELLRIELLTQLGAYTDAALAIERLPSPPGGVEPDHLLFAETWRQVGRPNQAREALTRAVEAGSLAWRAAEIHAQRFRLELAYGDASSALASYEAFRDTGFSADPFLRDRLRLALRHPSAPWRPRDALGVLALLGVVASCALAPGLIVIPVHYFGLIRARSRPERALPRTRFGLRHCWYALAVLFVSEIPFLYVDGVIEVTEWMTGLEGSSATAPQPFPERPLARAGIAGTALALVGIAVLFRRRDAAMLGRGSWSRRRTLFACAASLVAIRMLLGVWLQLFPQLTEGAMELGTALASTPSLTTQLGNAIGRLYGLPTLFFFLAVAVPLCEELAFRGVLLQGFQRYLPFGWANALQALLFAALHEAWPVFPYFLAMGLLAGSFARRSGGLAAPLLLHAGNNALAFVRIAQGLGGG